jgi:hypothetical protein
MADFARVPPDRAREHQAMRGEPDHLAQQVGVGALLQQRTKAHHLVGPSVTPDISGLAVEEHVARLRDKLLPLVEKSHRIARESIEAISRLRQAPSLSVERSEGIRIVLVPIGEG